MKAIKGLKRYDTEAGSSALHTVEIGGGVAAGGYIETLYRTDKGSYFLSGASGPDGPWAIAAGTNRQSGAGVRALTESEAADWLAQHDLSKAEGEFAAKLSDA